MKFALSKSCFYSNLFVIELTSMDEVGMALAKVFVVDSQNRRVYEAVVVVNISWDNQ